MKSSIILEETIEYKQTTKKNATHFIICKTNKPRYFIDINNGKEKMVKSLSIYSLKLKLLTYMIKHISFTIMEKMNIGYFCSAYLCDEVNNFIKDKFNPKGWNVIVGTYDHKQKIVIQLWDDKNKTNYCKIGNNNTNNEMITEINYLKLKYRYKTFYIPELIDFQMINDINKFNIQITEGFRGKRVDPVMNENIYKIFKEVSSSKENYIKDGIVYTFSHGDFAPWNIKKDREKYVLFDWEHCRMRFYGFDIIHYIYQIETLLNKKSKKNAIDYAIKKSKEYDPILRSIDDCILKKMYFEERAQTY